MPTRKKWLNKLWYLHSVEYYKIKKKKKNERKNV
jgi:hypothetical protein